VVAKKKKKKKKKKEDSTSFPFVFFFKFFFYRFASFAPLDSSQPRNARWRIAIDPAVVVVVVVLLLFCLVFVLQPRPLSPGERVSRIAPSRFFFVFLRFSSSISSSCFLDTFVGRFRGSKRGSGGGGGGGGGDVRPLKNEKKPFFFYSDNNFCRSDIFESDDGRGDSSTVFRDDDMVCEGDPPIVGLSHWRPLLAPS